MPTTLPASAAAWQLYTYEDGKRPEGRVAIRSVVKALNDSVRAAAADPALRAAIKGAKKAHDRYWSVSDFAKSPEWKAVIQAEARAFIQHIDPVLNQYAVYGAADSEPMYVARTTLNRLIVDALGITDSFSREWLGFE
jgi:hypothetical protein